MVPFRAMRRLAWMVAAVLLFGAGARGERTGPDLGAHFEGIDGTFVLYDVRRDRYVRYNERRAAERKSPCSTFKIPNMLIALDAGVVADAETVFRWTPEKYRARSKDDGWARDHTLRSAFKASAVWAFRELARGVGAERYRKYLAAFDYGNRDISGGVDQFWLMSSLAISADEQVEFLAKLHAGRLHASPRAIAITKEVFVLEQTPEYRLSAKTGASPLDPGRRTAFDGEGPHLGWLVGYVERGEDVYVFALNIDGPSFDAIRDKRMALAKAILRDLGALPAETQSRER